MNMAAFDIDSMRALDNDSMKTLDNDNVKTQIANPKGDLQQITDIFNDESSVHPKREKIHAQELSRPSVEITFHYCSSCLANNIGSKSLSTTPERLIDQEKQIMTLFSYIKMRKPH